ncbi:MAG: hypothetical protein CL678_16215 [Bdellovibrionaceae bacterium]|nr:hypothetical protein [Pseudobdellovibrionaceae bacterium]
MKWNRITRRHFLQGVGGAALTLPFLPSLLTKELLGSGGTPPKRFIALMSQNGAIQDYNLYPAALPMNSFSVPNGHNAHSDTLINILGAQSELSPVLGSFLNPYLSKMNIIRGLDWRFRIGHHYGANLGNVAGSVPVEGGNNINSFTPMATIDQLMAYSNAVYPTMSGIAERSMIINPLGSQGLSYSYQDPFNKTGDVSLLPTISNPRVLFNTLFSSIIAAQSEGSGPSDGSIFNAVYEDFQRLWNNSRLGSEDRQRLDSHMNFLSETESKVNQVNGSCSVPATPPDINHIYTADLATVEASYQAFNDVIAAAIRCDISRLATIHISKVLDIPG